MKSLARRLLESTLSEDDGQVGITVTAPGPDAGAKPSTPDPDGDHVNTPGEHITAMQQVTEACDDPQKMAECLDVMHAHADKFLDEADEDTYTAKDVGEKDDIQSAKGSIEEASALLKGKSW